MRVPLGHATLTLTGATTTSAPLIQCATSSTSGTLGPPRHKDATLPVRLGTGQSAVRERDPQTITQARPHEHERALVSLPPKPTRMAPISTTRPSITPEPKTATRPPHMDTTTAGQLPKSKTTRPQTYPQTPTRVPKTRVNRSKTTVPA